MSIPRGPLVLFVLICLSCSTVPDGQEAPLSPDTIWLDKVHSVTDLDGDMQILTEGAYRVMAWDADTLALVPREGGGPTVRLPATAVEHGMELAEPRALCVPAEETGLSRLLFAEPGGSGLESLFTRSHQRTRGPTLGSIRRLPPQPYRPPPTKPDLIVSNLEIVPNPAIVGQAPLLYITTRNIGTGPVSDYHLRIDYGCGFSEPPPLTQDPVRRYLSPGASHRIIQTLPPLDICDRWTVEVRVATRSAAELRYDNNTRTMSFDVVDPRPDLVVTSIERHRPEEPVLVGGRYLSYVTVANVGGGPVSASGILAELWFEFRPKDSGTPEPARAVAAFSVPGPLAVGESKVLNLQWTAEPRIGELEVQVRLDPRNAIEEIADQNIFPAEVVSVRGPDLTVSAVRIPWTDHLPAAGQTLDCRVTVANPGPAPLKSTRCEIGLESFFTPEGETSEWPGWSRRTSWSGVMPDLPPGGRYTVDIPFETHADPGTWRVEARVDPNRLIEEESDSNNSGASTVETRAYPDLVARVIGLEDAIADLSPNTMCDIALELENLGPGPLAVEDATASGGFLLWHEISFQPDGGALETFSAGEVSLQMYEALTPGGSLETTLGFTTRPEAGTYVIRLEANQGRKFGEVSFANNEVRYEFRHDPPPPPDLVVRAIRPTQPFDGLKPGDSCTLVPEIENLGPGNLESCDLYLDMGVEFMPMGSQQFTVLVSGGAHQNSFHYGLEVGETTDGTSVSFDLDPRPGQYRVRARVGLPSGVVEAEPSNNERVLEFTIHPPDLVVKSIELDPRDATPRASDNGFALNVEIGNDGLGILVHQPLPFRIDLLLWEEGSTEWVMLTTHRVEPMNPEVHELLPGRTDFYRFTVMEVNRAGRYRVVFRLDPNGDLPEAREDNNDLEFEFEMAE